MDCNQMAVCDYRSYCRAACPSFLKAVIQPCDSSLKAVSKDLKALACFVSSLGGKKKAALSIVLWCSDSATGKTTSNVICKSPCKATTEMTITYF